MVFGGLLMKKLLIYLLCLSVFIFSGCNNPNTLTNTNNSSVEQNISNNTNDYYNLISSSILQYPAQNDLYEYNVFDKYIEITKYLGEDSNIVVPDKIDGLPVVVIGGFNKHERGYKDILKDDNTIKSVTIPDTVCVISEDAFAETSVTSVIFGKNITEIGKNAFWNSQLSGNIQLPDTTLYIRDGAFKGTRISEIELGNNVVEIGSEAFNNCDNLIEITIPSSVSKIGKETFTNASGAFKEITIQGYAGSYVAQYVSNCTDDGIRIQFEVIN